MKRLGWLAVAAALALGGFALRRQALFPVTQACVANFRLTGAAFPCLEVTPYAVVFRPFWAPDLILAPTRQVRGVEDPFLQTDAAPNYFAEAWEARRFLDGAAREDIALFVNPAAARSQDQLHIHIGCLKPEFRAALARLAPQTPADAWVPMPDLLPHIAFWGTRVERATLDGVAPFRAAAAALADRVTDRARFTIGVAAVRVEGAPQFVLLASYVGAPHSWWAVGAENLADTHCGAGLSAGSRYAPANIAPAAARP